MRNLVWVGMIVSFLGIAGCRSDPGPVGSVCIDGSDCEAGLSCFNRPGGGVTPVCMADCDLDTTRVCMDGSVCMPREGGGLGVCYLGGSTPLGFACTNQLACISGTVCVINGGAQSCVRACVVGDGSHCEDGETCSMLMGGDGFCAP